MFGSQNGVLYVDYVALNLIFWLQQKAVKVFTMLIVLFSKRKCIFF